MTESRIKLFRTGERRILRAVDEPDGYTYLVLESNQHMDDILAKLHEAACQEESEDCAVVDEFVATPEGNDYPTEAARHIMETILQEWVDKFLEKNGDYGDTYKSLGSAGQFAEIWRKVPKLKRAMWDHIPLSGEQPREILMDLIGHCFMAIHLIDKAES